jgi:hypothetical protein
MECPKCGAFPRLFLWRLYNGELGCWECVRPEHTKIKRKSVGLNAITPGQERLFT